MTCESIFLICCNQFIEFQLSMFSSFKISFWGFLPPEDLQIWSEELSHKQLSTL